MRSWNSLFLKGCVFTLMVAQKIMMLLGILWKFWWSSENSDDRQNILMIIRKFWWSSENYNTSVGGICNMCFFGETYLIWCIIWIHIWYEGNLFAHAFLDHIKGIGPLISQWYRCLGISFWHSDKWFLQIADHRIKKSEEWRVAAE